MKYLSKSTTLSVGTYYTNLLGRAISTYNNKETCYLLEGEQLLIFNNIQEITLVKAYASSVVVILTGGGAMPTKVGSWFSKQQLLGSLYSISIYEKEIYYHFDNKK